MNSRLASLLTSVAILATVVWPGIPKAQESAKGIENPTNWYYAPLYLREEGRLPAGIEATVGLAAAYNYAYDGTVLGVNFKLNDAIEYYGACCLVDGDGNLDVLEVLGPFPDIVEWHVGPYHLAAGTPAGSVHCWLTAPREYPREVVLTNDYEPGTAFSVQVHPPEQAVPQWSEWLVTIAFQSHFNPVIRFSHVAGSGRNRGGLADLPMAGLTEALDLDFWPTEAGVRPYLLVGSRWRASGTISRNTSHQIGYYHYEESQEGWVRESLETLQSFPQGFMQGTNNLMAYRETPSFAVDYEVGQDYVELISKAGRNPRRLRPGTRALLPPIVYPELFSFLDSSLGGMPFVIFSDQTDISVGRLIEQPGLPEPLVYQQLLLHSGATDYIDGEPYPRYPVVALATAAHWDTGYPEVYWVQAGSATQRYGQLFRLRYVPTK